ncbi:hypothetical protein Ocin01_18034 [Orchesella cincta]|uniref:Uncharacterized protein n=1 Tax=Orchesella cincta TaxID=48709 RepID=A0A1D2M6Q2_ORCCI|nr:hypothetical protein Ocin01_18034 [Orchesella cincta]
MSANHKCIHNSFKVDHVRQQFQSDDVQCVSTESRDQFKAHTQMEKVEKVHMKRGQTTFGTEHGESMDLTTSYQDEFQRKEAEARKRSACYKCILWGIVTNWLNIPHCCWFFRMKLDNNSSLLLSGDVEMMDTSSDTGISQMQSREAVSSSSTSMHASSQNVVSSTSSHEQQLISSQQQSSQMQQAMSSSQRQSAHDMGSVDSTSTQQLTGSRGGPKKRLRGGKLENVPDEFLYPEGVDISSTSESLSELQRMTGQTTATSEASNVVQSSSQTSQMMQSSSMSKTEQSESSSSLTKRIIRGATITKKVLRGGKWETIEVPADSPSGTIPDEYLYGPDGVQIMSTSESLSEFQKNLSESSSAQASQLVSSEHSAISVTQASNRNEVSNTQSSNTKSTPATTSSSNLISAVYEIDKKSGQRILRGAPTTKRVLRGGKWETTIIPGEIIPEGSQQYLNMMRTIVSDETSQDSRSNLVSSSRNTSDFQNNMSESSTTSQTQASQLMSTDQSSNNVTGTTTRSSVPGQTSSSATTVYEINQKTGNRILRGPPTTKRVLRSGKWETSTIQGDIIPEGSLEYQKMMRTLVSGETHVISTSESISDLQNNLSESSTTTQTQASQLVSTDQSSNNVTGTTTRSSVPGQTSSSNTSVYEINQKTGQRVLRGPPTTKRVLRSGKWETSTIQGDIIPEGSLEYQKIVSGETSQDSRSKMVSTSERSSDFQNNLSESSTTQASHLVSTEYSAISDSQTSTNRNEVSDSQSSNRVTSTTVRKSVPATTSSSTTTTVYEVDQKTGNRILRGPPTTKRVLRSGKWETTTVPGDIIPEGSQQYQKMMTTITSGETVISDETTKQDIRYLTAERTGVQQQGSTRHLKSSINLGSDQMTTPPGKRAVQGEPTIKRVLKGGKLETISTPGEITYVDIDDTTTNISKSVRTRDDSSIRSTSDSKEFVTESHKSVTGKSSDSRQVTQDGDTVTTYTTTTYVIEGDGPPVVTSETTTNVTKGSPRREQRVTYVDEGTVVSSNTQEMRDQKSVHESSTVSSTARNTENTYNTSKIIDEKTANHGLKPGETKTIIRGGKLTTLSGGPAPVVKKTVPKGLKSDTKVSSTSREETTSSTTSQMDTSTIDESSVVSVIRDERRKNQFRGSQLETMTGGTTHDYGDVQGLTVVTHSKSSMEQTEDQVKAQAQLENLTSATEVYGVNVEKSLRKAVVKGIHEREISRGIVRISEHGVETTEDVEKSITEIKAADTSSGIEVAEKIESTTRSSDRQTFKFEELTARQRDEQTKVLTRKTDETRKTGQAMVEDVYDVRTTFESRDRNDVKSVAVADENYTSTTYLEKHEGDAVGRDTTYVVYPRVAPVRKVDNLTVGEGTTDYRSSNRIDYDEKRGFERPDRPKLQRQNTWTKQEGDMYMETTAKTEFKEFPLTRQEIKRYESTLRPEGDFYGKDKEPAPKGERSTPQYILVFSISGEKINRNYSKTFRGPSKKWRRANVSLFLKMVEWTVKTWLHLSLSKV